MPWIDACAAYADGRIDSHDFRRLRAVTSVVETVGLTDARFYAERIREWGGDWLQNPEVKVIDAWGNPIRCPRLLLGTNRAFSPTTLRYLATALWLNREGYINRETRIVEIGVGFGGLTAMNAVVSGAKTFLVDLPQVSRSTLRMLSENNLEGYGIHDGESKPTEIDLVISNYAFTELSADLQDTYLRQYLLPAKHGVIISNAAVFSTSIKGRDDEQLITWLNAAGIPAIAESSNTLLSPIDALCGVRMIRW